MCFWFLLSFINEYCSKNTADLDDKTKFYLEFSAIQSRYLAASVKMTYCCGSHMFASLLDTVSDIMPRNL